VHLSPAGQLQIATALDMLAAAGARMDMLRRQLLHAARHLAGAKALADRLYGVGPVTGLALTCWPGGAGRFSSSRKAVRFAGLDVTVYSSDGKRSPGHLSRQGPEILRWVVYEAGKTHARAAAPGHDYYAAVKDRTDGKIAALSQAARSSGRPATSWPSPATTRSPSPEPHRPAKAVTITVTPAPGGRQAAAALTRWGYNRGQLPQRPSARTRPAAQGHADGLKRLSGRIPRRRGTPDQSSCHRAPPGARGPR
jgi:hypothetical protein